MFYRKIRGRAFMLDSSLSRISHCIVEQKQKNWQKLNLQESSYNVCLGNIRFRSAIHFFSWQLQHLLNLERWNPGNCRGRASRKRCSCCCCASTISICRDTRLTEAPLSTRRESSKEKEWERERERERVIKLRPLNAGKLSSSRGLLLSGQTLVVKKEQKKTSPFVFAFGKFLFLCASKSFEVSKRSQFLAIFSDLRWLEKTRTTEN